MLWRRGYLDPGRHPRRRRACWDGQERSTRYASLQESGYFTPPGLVGEQLERYTQAAGALFAAYASLTDRLLAVLVDELTGRPRWTTKAFELRTLRARAFDVTRGILPLATITSLGQVVSARVLERQISRLLSDPLPEVQDIGERLRQACREPATQPLATPPYLNGTAQSADAHDPPADAIRAAPTLVKYTAPSEYQIKTRAVFEALAQQLLAPLMALDRARTVEPSGTVVARR